MTKTKKPRIFRDQWLDFHPYTNTVKSDIYFVQLCNEVLNTVETVCENTEDCNYIFIPDNEKEQLACILTCYFEDIISESNIWNAFTRVTMEKTGRWLPFFDMADYEEEEINEADIRFLCWHFMMQLERGESPLSPYEPLFAQIAKAVYAIFDREFETAPANEHLKNYLSVDEDTDIYALEGKFFWLGTESYLFSFNSRDLDLEVKDLSSMIEEEKLGEHANELLQMTLSDFAFNNVTELWRLRSAQWLGHVLGKNHPLADSLLELSTKKSGYFTFVEQDSLYAQFRHVATGKIIHVTNRSIAYMPDELKSPQKVLFAGFIEWEGEWWFIGQLNAYEATPEFIKEVSRIDTELTLFDELGEGSPSFDDQLQAANKLIAEQKEANASADEEDQVDAEWLLLTEPELDREFLLHAIAQDSFAHLQFPGMGGKALLQKNAEFVVDYFKR
jgi:hypothetical protein